MPDTITADDTIAIGDTVELTADACRQFRKRNPGRIIGEAFSGTCWKIIWGGNHTTTTMHKSFVQLTARHRRCR